MRRDAKQCACISRELLHWTYFTMRNWIEPNRFVKCSCVYAYVGMYAYTCTRTRIRKSRKNVIKYVIHAYYFKLSIECPNIKYIIARLNRVFSFMLSIYIYISFSLPLYLNSIRLLIKNDTSQIRLIFIITNWYNDINVIFLKYYTVHKNV